MRGFLSIPACDVYVRLETTGAAMKIARDYRILSAISRAIFTRLA